MNPAPLTVTMFGHLHHGTAPGPFLTEKVSVTHEGADRYKARYEGRWRRVHIRVKRTFIVYRGEKITIQIEGV